MPSLSERAKQILDWSKDYTNTNFVTSLVARMMPEVASAIESLTEARVVASNHIETLSLRIEELEAQVAQLTPPKDIGPVVKPAWQKISESDLPAEGM